MLALGADPTARQPTPVLRPMSRTDVRAVARIEADRHPLDAWSGTLFHEALDEPARNVCLVLADPEAPTDLVAYGVVSVAAETADLDNLTVRRDAERRGHGRRLLVALLDEAARRGAGEVLLEVRPDNDAAVALYAADGFVEINRRRDYYAPGVDAIVMRRALRAPTGPGPEPAGA